MTIFDLPFPLSRRRERTGVRVAMMATFPLTSILSPRGEDER